MASVGIGRSVASAKTGRRTVPRQAGEKLVKEKTIYAEASTMESFNQQCRNFEHAEDNGSVAATDAEVCAGRSQGKHDAPISTGNNALDVLIKQAMRDEALIKQLRTAVERMDANEVFRIAKELTQ